MFIKRLYCVFADNTLIASILFSLLLFIGTYYFLGFHYGWIDDVLQNNYLQGIGLVSPAKQMFNNQIFLGQIYHSLYTFWPSIPWYGYFALAYVFIANVQIVYLFTRIFKSTYCSNLFFFYCFAFIFYVLFCIDFVMLVTFTKTAIVLVGSSTLLLNHVILYEKPSTKKTLLIIWCIATLLIGVLNRIEVIYLLSIPLILYVFRYKNISTYKVVGLYIVTILLGVFLYKILTNDEIELNVKKINHILNITDGKNTYGNSYMETINKDFRYKSLYQYYWPDSIIISDETLAQMGADKFYSISNLNNLSIKLKYEINRAIKGYGDDYLKNSNWWYVFVFYAVCNVMFTIYLYQKFKVENPQVLINHFLFLSAILGLLLFILIFYKLEGRLVLPTVLIMTMVSIYTCSQLDKFNMSYQKKWLLLLLMIPLLNYQLKAHHKVSIDRKFEERLKRDFINEMNQKFQNKVILFDIWSLSLLHTSLLEQIDLEKSNKYISHFESWSNFVPGNVEALNEICPCGDFVSFYKCIYEDKDEFVFVLTKDRRYGFIEEYADQMHGYHLKFKEIDSNSYLSKVHYTMLPWRYDFSYLALDHFEPK